MRVAGNLLRLRRFVVRSKGSHLIGMQSRTSWGTLHGLDGVMVAVLQPRVVAARQSGAQLVGQHRRNKSVLGRRSGAFAAGHHESTLENSTTFDQQFNLTIGRKPDALHDPGFARDRHRAICLEAGTHAESGHAGLELALAQLQHLDELLVDVVDSTAGSAQCEAPRREDPAQMFSPSHGPSALPPAPGRELGDHEPDHEEQNGRRNVIATRDAQSLVGLGQQKSNHTAADTAAT